MPENYLKFRSAIGKRRVLVVEDELVNRELLCLLIQDEYEAVYAENGAEALAVIDAQYEALSLVLLDLNLPDMKGQDILRRVKGDVRMATLPVIVMTADSEAEVECLRLGATDFIPKPYPKQEVILARMLRTIELFEDRDIIRSTERDGLTGLYNREYFFRYAAQFDVFHPNSETDAVLLDVYHFHILNERCGRSYGDEVLRRIASCLLDAVGLDNGIVCRREADTFLIYCLHRESYADIWKSVSGCMGEENPLRIRLGVYSCTDRGIEIEHRFDRAKLAADTARASFAEPIAVYDDAMHEREVFAEQLMADFPAALREKQFSVYYQPKFDVRAEEPVLCGAEALVRWNHPSLGFVSPGAFIPLFEENGLIRELDSYVWRKAAAQIAAWKQALGRSIPVSVNVSRIDLYDPALQETLEGITAEFGLAHGELHLEITESAYTENADQIISVVKCLRERGFCIEMDDFGTGYSSLNMFTALPIDVLKLDMQFIRMAFKKRKDTRLLESIIGLAKSMELPTIAEGVETAEQMFTMKAMGCDVIQGYFFSKPLPAGEFETFVRGLEVQQSESAAEENAAPRHVLREHFTYDALHDPATGLYNQSAFDILFEDSDKEHIAIMVATVDDYAELSREHGQDYTQRIARRIAEELRRSFRSTDDICRLQDDEFAVIISRMNRTLQPLVLQKIEQINAALRTERDGVGPISLSIGIAFSDRDNPQGDVFVDAETALKKLKTFRQSGFAIY